YVMLAVSDDGCGMNQETQSHLFEPFFTTKEVGKGTGLGLATVYGIVKQNNGFANVYSEVGKGTTFKIYFPRHEGNAVTETTPDSLRIPEGHGETVLLVEDDLSILAMGKAMLERLGYAILTAGDTNQALDLAKVHGGPIHLLMTDVVMPQMSGKDLALQMRTLNPEIKVLFMSGYTTNIIAHRGILDEAVHFIQKPFSMKNLASKVRKALEGR
ncbi:MAG: hybrid sensor histidine kinase/response regulator, partial [Desulfobacterales bacterium CG07_land_8_20_14_0_80_52_14]